jgi:Zn-dependent peptidase ImmA (M78 family)
MAVDYPSAVRNGTMQATRLHNELGTQSGMAEHGGGIDVFGATCAVGLPLLLRPLQKLLGAYIPAPIPGVLVTTERPLSIQRFTAAHELGHFKLEHLPSLDDESLLRRMTTGVPARRMSDPELQEIEADAFAVSFLMPRWLIAWHCARQKWIANDLAVPHNVYQLSLRIGASYEATTWTLERYKYISVSSGRALRLTKPRELKAELLADYEPSDYRGDVWLLTDKDADTRIDGSRNDHFILRLNEHSGAGYLWNIDQLQESGIVIVRDGRSPIDDGIGSPVVREVTAAMEDARRGVLELDESRPWSPSEPLTKLSFNYDFTGPEQAGYSRSEQRRLLEAA